MTPRLSLSEQTAVQAEFIVNNLQHTVYQHVSNIDVDRGVYDCDCNGFLSFVLERSAPDHYAMIPKETNQLRPRAFEYYVFFSGLTPHSTGGWHQIDFLRDVLRGDIIAWRLRPRLRMKPAFLRCVCMTPPRSRILTIPAVTATGSLRPALARARSAFKSMTRAVQRPFNSPHRISSKLCRLPSGGWNLYLLR
jgi:hypothetical protein